RSPPRSPRAARSARRCAAGPEVGAPWPDIVRTSARRRRGSRAGHGRSAGTADTSTHRPLMVASSPIAVIDVLFFRVPFEARGELFELPGALPGELRNRLAPILRRAPIPWGAGCEPG